MMHKVQAALKQSACKAHGRALARFFQTHKGGYGEGDVFSGVRMPDIRKIAKQHKDMSVKSMKKLLHSRVHEERMCALIILMHQFSSGDTKKREQIYKLYLKSIKKCINNWDLVDVSAPHVVGAYLYKAPRTTAKKTLQQLAVSKNLWERRVAIIATLFFIRNGRFGETLGIAQMLRDDKHDLIHKAVGWMLREVGNRNKEVEERFLKKYYKTMPRTMLRYAIEKFPEPLRKKYLKGEV